jgi:hypothetical protein
MAGHRGSSPNHREYQAPKLFPHILRCSFVALAVFSQQASSIPDDSASSVRPSFGIPKNLSGEEILILCSPARKALSKAARDPSVYVLPRPEETAQMQNEYDAAGILEAEMRTPDQPDVGLFIGPSRTAGRDHLFEDSYQPPFKVENGAITISTVWGKLGPSLAWQRLLIVRGSTMLDKGIQVKWEIRMDFDVV